ncbi:GAF domain-containing protein [Actinoallomurus acaciae]|uniref:GAF domain-containing protein n=1 Tax=Actinoallomurus acaciae TaxID=502577 RepID=A0ABV5Y9S1_9ACTN
MRARSDDGDRHALPRSRRSRDRIPPLGGRWPLRDDTASAAALRTHRPARRAVEAIHNEIGDWHRETDVGHVVACPVIVDGRLWGTMACLYIGSEPPPNDTEERMGKVVELLNSTITQAETRAELLTSRARLVGTIQITSPAGGGTSLAVAIPCPSQTSPAAERTSDAGRSQPVGEAELDDPLLGLAWRAGRRQGPSVAERLAVSPR